MDDFRRARDWAAAGFVEEGEGHLSKIRLIESRDVIKAVRDKWMNQYRSHPGDALSGWGQRRRFGEIRRALAELDLETCSVADVDATLGVTGWASLICDECDADCERLVRLGEEPDYDVRWQDVCADCLRKAMTLCESQTRTIEESDSADLRHS